MFAELFSPEQIAILTQIIFIDLVLAGDNAIIIGMVASKFDPDKRKKNNILGYKCSGYLKDIIYFNNNLFVNDHWSKINRWNFTTLYMLQAIF